MNRETKIRLLWVDDEIAMYTEFVRAIERYGVEVKTASTAEAALYKLSTEDFDIVITDIFMPGRSGISFLKEAIECGKSACYIILSSYLHVDQYRTQLEVLSTPVHYFDKIFPDPDSPEMALFIARILDCLDNRAKSASFLHSLWESIEIKPGFGGVALDIKKLLSK